MDKIHVNCDFTIEEIDSFLHGRRIPYLVTLEQVIDYWGKKNWLTLKGQKVSTVSVAVNVANSHYVELQRKSNAIGYKDKSEKNNKEKEWLNNKSPYYEQLNTPQWKAYREFIFTVRGRSCEICGHRKNLHIHHLSYINNRFAWEYLPNEVLVVCGNCHRNIHNLANRGNQFSHK